MLNLDDVVWAGTEAAYDAAATAEGKILARLQAGPFTPDKEFKPYTMVDSVAVVPVRGPLVNIDSPILAFFGVTGYPSIRRALVAAATDPAVDQILLDVDSGGGSVAGVSDVGALIAKINDSVKPVTTYSDGNIASAAYWLGVSAQAVFISPTTVAGSIGVIAKHVDRTKENEMAGRKVTVFRGGKYKALVNPDEALTPDARKQIESQLDAAYNIFVRHVADRRGVSYQVAHEKMADGREFFGAQAKDARLVDGVTTFDAVLSKLREKKNLDKRRPSYDNGINNQRSGQMTTKAALTEQDIAQLATGAAALTAGDPDAEAKAKAEAEAAAAAEAEAKAKAEAEAAAATEAEAQAAAELKAKTEAGKNQGELVAYLNGQIKEKDAALTQAAIDLKAAKDKLAETEATHEGLLQIARDSVNKMQIALGGSAMDLKGSTAVQILEQHKQVLATFTETFKVGGVAATAPEGKTEAKAKATDPVEQARLNAVRPKTK